MRRRTAGAIVVLVALAATMGIASAKPTLHFTARERSACRDDAVRFCASTYPDRRKLVNCLQAHRSSLDGACRKALYRGVSERPSLLH